jgi:YbgC/YbaW family acyl-CoA thioester hydrolase
MGGYIHERTFRVAMAEVDVAQIHFTALHRWIDRGLSEWLAEVGYPFTRLLAEGPGVPIVNITTRIAGRILLDDMITHRTWVGAAGRTSFRTRHRFTRGHELMAESELVHVCVDRVTRETLTVPGWVHDNVVDDPVQVAARS